MNQNFSVKALLDTFANSLDLKWVGGARGEQRAFAALDSAYDFANLVGFFNPIRMPQIALVGEQEFDYLQNLRREQRELLEKRLIVARPVCLIVSDNQLVPPYLLRQDQWPLLTSGLSSERIMVKLRKQLPAHICRRWVLHGTFVSLFGQGILITGEENSGKSTLALELLERGHRLIADDAPEFGIVEQDRVEGFAPASTRGLLASREMGLIDVAASYGQAALCPRHRLDAIVRLQASPASDARNPLEQPQQATILGQPFPEWTLNNSSLRSLTTLVEACARQLLQSQHGIAPIKTLNKQLNRAMREGVE